MVVEKSAGVEDLSELVEEVKEARDGRALAEKKLARQWYRRGSIVKYL